MRWCRTLLLAIGLPSAASAQGTGSAPSDAACLDALPPSALSRVPLYVVPGPSERYPEPPAPLLDAIDSLSHRVALRAAAMLPSTEAALREASPRFGWRDLGGEVDVVAWRDGRFRASVIPAAVPGGAMTGDAATRLLASALDSLQPHFRFPWPAHVAGDSVHFSVELTPATVDPDGRRVSPDVRSGFPFAALSVPVTHAVVPKRQPAPRYPDRLVQAGYQGTVPMYYVVGTDGRVVRSTIRSIPRPELSAFAGEDAVSYGLFVQAVTEALARSQFEPGKLGGCIVAQAVRQEFSFKLRR